MATAFQANAFQTHPLAWQIELVAGFICNLNVSWRATSITTSITFNTIDTGYVCRP